MTLDVLILLIYFYSQLSIQVDVRLFSDAFNLVQLLKSPHPKPAEKHLLIELRKIQELLDVPKGDRIPRLKGKSEKRLEKELGDSIIYWRLRNLCSSKAILVIRNKGV